MARNKAVLSLLVHLLLVLKECDAIKSLIINVPEVVKAGETVTLGCEYDLEQVALYTIKWYWNEQEFYRFVPKESPPSLSFPMPHINVDLSSSGPTEVTLIKVHRELSGTYKCEVSEDAPLFHTDIRTAHMTVVAIPTSDPVLEVQPLKVEIGKIISADCYCSGSDPAANITWYINDAKITRSEDDIRLFPLIVETDQALNLQTSRAKIEITANKTLFQTGSVIIRCETSIYGVWSQVVDKQVRDETPVLSPAMGSTSSQSHSHEKYDVLKSAARVSFPGSLLVVTSVFFYIFTVR